MREPRPRILIVSEGTTEWDYFTRWRHETGSRLLEITFERNVGVPKTVVERAIALRRDAASEARRARDSTLRFDAVWCLFDCDEHPHLDDALIQARDNSINVALSNPCFELWLLLHFQDQRAFITRDTLISECAKQLVGYAKRIDGAIFEQLKPRYAEAITRATDLDSWQRGRGCSGHNPWTGVFKLANHLSEMVAPVYARR